MFLSAQLNAIGGYKFDNSVQTAGTDGKELLINETFWNGLNETEKQFLLDHEIMHITCNHHDRISQLPDLYSLGGCPGNAAADLSINSVLYDQYVGDQDPTKIIPTLWHMGMFPQHYGYKCGLTMEAYYAIFQQNPSRRNELKINGFGSNIKSSAGREFAKRALAAINEIIEGYSSGSQSFDQQHKEIAIFIKRSFATLMKDLIGNTSCMQKMQLEDRWGHNKRMPWSALPSERMTEVFKGTVRKNKIGLFLDFSGSCKKLAPVFTKLASMIPLKNFVVSYHKFADCCQKIKHPNEEALSIGGGTNFESIRPYTIGMDQVWIFTDGCGMFLDIEEKHKNFVWFIDRKERNIDFLPQHHRFEILSNYAEANIK